jgi:EAL domain-containing protein (putative c-di-GMP-specific phosphodiesterase class I)
VSSRTFLTRVQPVVHLATSEVVAYEAATRFVDPARPRLGLREVALGDLDRDLERATMSASLAAAAGLPATLPLIVKLSRRALRGDPALPELIAAAGRDVIVEVVGPIDTRQNAPMSPALCGASVSFALGYTGDAGLDDLLSLRPEYVMLDLEWVHALDGDRSRQSDVGALVSIAHEMGARVVARGIATPREQEILIRLGVPLGEGPLLGRAIPPLPWAA